MTTPTTDYVLTTEIAMREGRAGSSTKVTGSRHSAQRPVAIALRERTPAAKATTVKPVTEADFAATFRKLGLSESAARTAARGRGAKPVPPSTLTEAGRALGLSPAAAKAFAHGRSSIREVAKDVAGLPASCYAFTPDLEDPLSWKLQISRSADSGTGWEPDEDLVRAAVAQLPGIAGYEQAIGIPASALPGVKATLRSAWIACGASIDEMPRELAQEALRKPFERLGIKTEAGMQAAMRGREKRL